MDLLGLGISAFIGRFALSGYSSIRSPTLLRLTFAFCAIAIGFAILLGCLFAGSEQYYHLMLTVGLGFQATGYFFIALSHSIKSFDFVRRPKGYHMSFFYVPFVTAFIIPGNSIEHLIRSISFILLVYVSIETMASYMQSRKASTLLLGSGLGMLATSELMAWYNLIFPGSIFYYIAISVKVAGFATIFVPFSRFGMKSGLGRVSPQVGSGI